MRTTLRQLIFSRVSLIWLVLVAATMVSLGARDGGVRDLHLAACVIIAVAFIKIRFVIREFMEIRAAPLAMRLVADVWALAVCGTLITLYLTA